MPLLRRPRRFPQATYALLGLIGILPTIARADALVPPPAKPVQPPTVRHAPVAAPRSPMTATIAEPSAEAERSAVNALASPFGTRLPAATGQTLTAPVTVNANTSADGLTVTQSGGGRALTGSVTASSNALSAVKGITAGSGSGVNGVNSGTAGQAGKFEITNASSLQPSLLVTTAGSYNALQTVIKGTAKVDTAAVLGQHTGVTNYGIGVEGDGGYYGVKGTTPGSGYGVYGNSPSGYGVYGESPSGFGSTGVSTNSVGVFGQSTGDNGVYGLSSDSNGVYGYSSNGAGVYGESNNNYGIYAHSSNAFGLVAASDSTFAGVFYGPMYVSGKVVAASYDYTSDRAKKQDFAPIVAADVLDRIAAMPITSWDYIARPTERHIGPMAQDFHAAFGLGTDDTHIDVVDGIGVSLAAIQALQQQVKDKDARLAAQETRIAALEGQVAASAAAVDARFAALEQGAALAATARTPAADR